eukprot:2355379-Amphidinium_carterae.1
MFGDGPPDPEAQPAGEKDEGRHDDPDTGMVAEMVDYRTPSVPPPVPNQGQQQQEEDVPVVRNMLRPRFCNPYIGY